MTIHSSEVRLVGRKKKVLALGLAAMIASASLAAGPVGTEFEELVDVVEPIKEHVVGWEGVRRRCTMTKPTATKVQTYSEEARHQEPYSQERHRE